MKRLLLFILMFALVLTGCAAGSENPTEDTNPTTLPATEPSEPSGPSEPTEPSEPVPVVGWITEEGKTYYRLSDGSCHTGWLELDDTRYYLDENGLLQTGWLTLGKDTYYLKEDGSITRGRAVIDNRTYYFVSSGARIVIANPWNLIPDDYTTDLEDVEDRDGDYLPVDKICVEPLRQMFADCREAGHGVQLISAYRRHSTQITLYNNKVNYYLNLGYDNATAREEAAKVVAMPGTSEHEMGLAVDLVDTAYPYLDEHQETMPTQKWLMEHCWEYGFILRYPNGKTDSTGIIYEPWHYRYVGVDVALELKESGQTLEEYLEALTKE